MTCKLGGYIHLRHNNLWNTTAELLRSNGIRKGVETETRLISVSGELLSLGTMAEKNAKLDVCSRNLWALLAKAYADVRFLHPNAPSNATKTIPAMYRAHEMEKKRKYNAKVINI